MTGGLSAGAFVALGGVLAEVLLTDGPPSAWAAQRGIIRGMAAMTLRLDDDECDALRRQAEQEGRSMQQVVHEALREDLERRDPVRAGPTRPLRELLASWEPLGPPGVMSDVVALIREARETH